jgi:hypothetical protein
MADEQELDDLEITGDEEAAADTDSDDDASLGTADDLFAEDEEAQQALMTLYETCSAEDRFARLIEVKDVKQAEFYWAGRQYIWWSSDDQRWKPPTAQAGTFADYDADDMPRYEYVTNVYQARGLMCIAAIAGAPPRVRFFPDDADDSDDIETAEGRTKEARLIQRWNPTQKLLQEETYHAWTGGFICLITNHVKDGTRFGSGSAATLAQDSEQPDATITCPNCGWSAPANEAEPPVPCPQCGTQLTDENVAEEDPIPVPVQGEDQDVPKGRQIISCYGALNCKRPQHVNHQSQFHYFGIEEEVHYSTLREKFQDVADKIKPGMNQGAEDVFERNARLSVSENTKLLTQSGAGQANLCTDVHAWFRPGAFWMIDNKSVRERVIEKAPHGCMVHFTGKVYLESRNESMDDRIATCHAMPGRGQHRNAVGTSMISVNDRVNTFANIEAETYEYGIPITYRASDTFNQDANEDQRAAPGLEVEVDIPAGTDIRQRILQVRADSVSPDMAQHANDLMGPIADQLTGTYPALTGAGAEQGAPDTVGQQSMQKDQAMGRMGIYYVNLKQLHADILTLACRDLERNSDEPLKIPILGDSGEFESESVDVTALEGEAEAYPEGDENFPELWNQQRATMMSVMDTPYGQQLVQDPDNADLFSRLLGIPDLKIPGMDARRKQLKEIAELTKPPKDEAGMTGPIAPMVEVDSDDNHPVESATCKWWLGSEKGQKCKRNYPPGFQAVKEHKAQHDAMIPKPEPATKPISESLTAAFKDMPTAAKIQMLAEIGIKVTAQDFVDDAGLESLKKQQQHRPAPGAPGQGAPPAGEPPNPAVSGSGV